MYDNLSNQNTMINQFNGYMTQNPNITPFQNNQLINQNVHVMNNLTDLLQQQRLVQQNMGMYQQMAQTNMLQPSQSPEVNNNRSFKSSKTNNKSKSTNIIEDMLKPQIIVKNNKDIESNYSVMKDNYSIGEDGQLKKKFKVTNAPYKNIIKDKIITKKVEDIKENDLLVHKSIKGIDANREKFDKELEEKRNEKEKINDELKIEFHIDNYDKHKKNFEYKESFIRNLAYEENIFDENKQDCIEFYRQKQKEAEDGQKLCDQILHNIVDDGVISKDELPTETSETNTELDLKSIINNIETEDETSNIKSPTSHTFAEQNITLNTNKTQNNSKYSNLKTMPKTILANNKKLNVISSRNRQLNTKRIVKV